MWMYTRNATNVENNEVHNREIHNQKREEEAVMPTSVPPIHRDKREHHGVEHVRELFGVAKSAERTVEHIIEPIAPWVEVVKPLERYSERKLEESIERKLETNHEKVMAQPQSTMPQPDNSIMPLIDKQGWWTNEASIPTATVTRTQCPHCRNYF